MYSQILIQKLRLKKVLNHLSNLGKEILIEKMVQDKVTEMIIGIKIDDQFGPVIIVGSRWNLHRTNE